MLIVLLLCLTLFNTYSGDEDKVRIKYISNITTVQNDGTYTHEEYINNNFYVSSRCVEDDKLFLLVDKVNEGEYMISKQPHKKYIVLRNNESDIELKGDTECNLNVKGCKISVRTYNNDEKNKSEKIYEIDLSNICCVVFKLVKPNEDGTPIYFLTTPNFWVEYDNSYLGMFEGTNYNEICIEHVFGNIARWVVLSYAFQYCNVKTISINKYNYKFRNIKRAFYKCENLEKINGLKYIFSDSVENCEELFCGCYKLKDIDIGGVKIPKKCGKMFSNTGVEKINMTDTDFANVDYLYLFFGNSDIKNVDFSIVKNLRPKNMTQCFQDCKKLENVNFNGIDFSELDRFYANFGNTPNLKTIDLSMCNIKGPIVVGEESKEIKLPDDDDSALLYLLSLQRSISDDKGGTNKFVKKIIWRGHELSNFGVFDDPTKFLGNPKAYYNDRPRIVESNYEAFKMKKNNIPNVGCCACCTKCCQNCCDKPYSGGKKI